MYVHKTITRVSTFQKSWQFSLQHGFFYSHLALLISLLIANPGAAKSAAKNPQTSTVAANTAIESVLNRQCEAWNRGDLDDFMSAYLHSEDTSYTSSGTEVWGYEALRDRYQKKYGQSRETMGTLKFSALRILPLGAKNALVIGHWHLDPQNPPAFDGVFSLVFVKTKEGWKVMHDHSSLDKKATP